MRARLAGWSADRERPLILSRGESGIALRRLLPEDTPFVYEAHRLCFEHRAEGGADTGWGRGFLGRLRLRRREAAALRRADALVCLTPAVRDALVRHFDAAGHPTLVLPSGTDCSPPPAAPRDLDVVYAGKLVERKGADLLVDALALLPGRCAAILGGTEAQCRALRERARRRGISDEALQLPGFVEPGRVRSFLVRARAGACPLPAGVSPVAERYTSPLKVLELMAAGTPVVASDLPSVREILSDGETGLLVPPNDAAALARALERVLGDEALAEGLRRRARAAVQAYAWERRASRLADFLTPIAHRGRVC